MTEPKQIWPLLARWVQPSQATLERASAYVFHARVARRWQEGRVLLAGDAAHQTPPFLGQGMCAAIRDVANLAWKLAAVAHGRADDALLDSFESERAPHVEAFIALAVELGGIIQTTDPEAARARDARFAAGGPEIFEFPAPRLGPGWWQGDADAVARPFPQPRLADGRLMDDVLKHRFVVVCDAELAEGLDLPEGIGLVTTASSPDAADHLARLGARATVLRPDRHTLGAADTHEELVMLLARVLPNPIKLQEAEMV
jgi:3-(3-hydroxy-phenyl)propionate hydroxylase